MGKRKEDRVCPKCKQDKASAYSSYCKKCANEYQKDYLKRNNYRPNETYKAKVRQMVTDAKAVPCMDCSISYPSYVMDLDHVRGTKKFVLSAVTSHLRAIASVAEEIAKCDPVCSNCHRIRTHNRRTGA